MIEGDRLRALLEAHLRVDFFGGAARRRAGSALTTGAVFQAAVTLGAGALLFLGLSPFAMATAGLTLVATLTALLLGAEAPLVLRLNDDRLAAFPVERSTVRMARALHAATYLVLGTTGAAIPIAVFMGFALGSVGGGLLTYLAALQQSVFFAAVGVTLDSVLSRSEATARLRPLASFLLTGALVAALFAGIRPLPEIERLLDSAGSALRFFPPAWFAAQVLALDGNAHALPAALDGLGGLGAAATATVLLLAALLHVRPAPPRHARPRATAIPAAAKALHVKPAERATFDLALASIARDPDLALRAGPVFAFPAALLLVGAAVKDPNERRLFVHVLLFVASAYLPTAVFLLARSRESRARSIFDTAPFDDAASLRDGVLKAAVLTMGLPLLAVLTFADSLVRGPATALLHAPLVALVELWVLDRAVEQLPDPFPLSQDLERLGGDTGEGVLGLAFGLTLFGFAEAWAVRGPLTALAAAAALAAGLVFQRRARRRRTGP